MEKQAFYFFLVKIQDGRPTSELGKLLYRAKDEVNSSWHVKFEQNLFISIGDINYQKFDLQ